MKKYILIFIILLGGVIIKSWFSTHCQRTNRVAITVDSVFINQYKQTNCLGPIYVYIYLSINNGDTDSLCFQTKSSLSFKERNGCYALYYGDTIPLLKREDFFVMPGQSLDEIFLLDEDKLPPPDNLALYDRLYEKYHLKFKYKTDFIEDVVISSMYIFDFEDWKYTIKPSEKGVIKVRYLDLPPEGYEEEHMWSIP